MIDKNELIEGAYYIGTCRNTKIAKWHKSNFIYINMEFNRPYIENIPYFGDVKELNSDGFIPIKKIEFNFNEIKNAKDEQDYNNVARKFYLNLSNKDINGEIWKDIPNYEGLYKISNLGRVKKHNTNKILRQNFSCEYLVIGLTGYDRLRKTMRVHRIVALTFKPNNNNNNYEVNHINGIKSDNRNINLEWITHSDNSKKTFLLGNKIKKLTPELVKEIKELINCGKMFQIEIAKKYNISTSMISEIRNNKKWVDIK